MSISTPDRIRRNAENLVDEVIHKIEKSPGDRAALRRAMGRHPEHVMARTAHAIVAPHVPADADETTERAFYAVAALIAAQPRNARDDDRIAQSEDAAVSSPSAVADQQSDSGGTPADAQDAEPRSERTRSLGRSLAEAVVADKLKPDPTEARLHLLCRQGVDGVHRHLPRLITQLRSDLVPVDWTTLVVDLSRWSRERDRVTKRWLQDYYRTCHRATASRGTPNTEQPESEDQ